MKSLLPLLAALPLLACAAEIAPTHDESRAGQNTADHDDGAEAEADAAGTSTELPDPGPCVEAEDGKLYAECPLAHGGSGVQRCSDEGQRGACAPVEGCDPRNPPSGCYTEVYVDAGADSGQSGFQMRVSDFHCTNREGVWQTQESSSECSTPLVLAFHQEAVSFTHPAGSFDVVGAGASFDTDWVSAATPWLALDLDGNGRIDDGAELFGSMTKLPDGKRAANGFEALAALDDDHDGAITSRDAVFAKLVVWSDANQDRASQSSELTTAAARGLVSIRLGYADDRRCTGTACEVERATFEWRGGTGAVIDVHFAAR